MPNKVSMIVAVDRNGNIGYAGDSKLPWHIPEDLKFFKEKTVGHPIIMGYNTFKSLPGILPNRHHFVVSSKRPEFVNPRMVAGISVFHSLESAIDIAKMYGTEVFVIGGATLYNYALDKKLVNKIYLTSFCTNSNDCSQFFILVVPFSSSNYPFTTFQFYTLAVEFGRADSYAQR